MRTMLRSLLVLGVLAAVVVPGVPAGAAVSNDDVADAVRITSLPFTDSVDVASATVAESEPSPGCAPFGPVGNTVWYEITPEARAPGVTVIVVDTAGSGYGTVVAVWTSDLAEVACSDVGSVVFSARNRTSYLVQVGSYGDLEEWESPDLTLSIGLPTDRREQRSPSMYLTHEVGATRWSVGEDGYSVDQVFFVVGKHQGEAPGLFVYSTRMVRDPDTGVETSITWTAGECGNPPLQNAAIEPSLGGAWVDQVVEMTGFACTFDPNTGEEVCDIVGQDAVRVQVTWMATGPVDRWTYREHEVVPPWRTALYHYRSKAQGASVTGGLHGEQVEVDLTGADGYLQRMHITGR